MTNPTCLTALKENLDEVEQAFSSVQLQLDTARYNLKVKDAQNGELFAKLKDSEAEEQRLRALERSSNAKLKASEAEERRLQALLEDLQACVAACITPKQAADQINKVHDELMEKLSAERKELELTQKLLKQARDERDAARSERDLARNAGQQAINERDRAQIKFRSVRAYCRAQSARIAELQSVGPALDILSTMVKELEARLEESEARRMATTETESVCHEHGHHGGKNCPMCFPPMRVTAEELFVKFKPVVYDLLKCIYNMTTPAVSALQYGSHHGHRALHTHIVRYRHFIGNKNNIDEVLRV